MIHLHAGPVINTLHPIVDPDPLLSCDLMDGRDAFLTLARDKHWEFSSLRRSKWSTLCMLVELHTQGQDRFVYTCNECKHHVETRWHCTVCEVRPSNRLSWGGLPSPMPPEVAPKRAALWKPRPVLQRCWVRLGRNRYGLCCSLMLRLPGLARGVDAVGLGAIHKGRGRKERGTVSSNACPEPWAEEGP